MKAFGILLIIVGITSYFLFSGSVIGIVACAVLAILGLVAFNSKNTPEVKKESEDSFGESYKRASRALSDFNRHKSL